MSTQQLPQSFTQLSEEQQYEHLACFRGICALYGYEGFFKLQDAHVVLVGTGGVGSWAAENLCRSGVGHLTLIDFDIIEITNSNRQMHTMRSTLGQAKVEVLGRRLKDINPFLDLKIMNTKLVAEENLQEVLESALELESGYLTRERREIQHIPAPDKLAQQWAAKGQPRFVIDAIDDLKAKTAMLDLLHRASIPCITAGGAGGRIHPELLRVGDISEAKGDQLIKRVRTELRRKYGYPQGEGKDVQPFHLLCTWSSETPQLSKHQKQEFGLTHIPELPQFGAAMSVTAVAGLLLSSIIIRWIVGSTLHVK